jgi:hypothetical protein
MRSPKLDSTPIPPPKLTEGNLDAHEDGLIDEAVDETFPASDPPTITQPGGTLAVKNIADEGRETPSAEPDPRKEHLRPRDD